LVPVTALAVAGMVLAACGSSSSSSPASSSSSSSISSSGSGLARNADIGFECPKKPMSVALAGSASLEWEDANFAAMQAEIAGCKTITGFKHTFASSLPEALSQFNSLVASGNKAIVVVPENGPSQLQSMAAAVKQGIAVVPILNNPGGTPGVDFQSAGFQNTVAGTADWAKFLAASVKSGKIVMLGGPAGATSSEAWMTGLKTALAQYPSLHLVQPDFVATGWTVAGVTSAVAGLLSKYGRIAGVAMDYGATLPGVITAYQDAHMALPAIATVASAEVSACTWQKSNFPYMSLGGSTFLGALGLKNAILVANGKNPGVSNVALPTIVDTASGENPPACDASLSATLPLTQALPAAQKKQAEIAVLGQSGSGS
jgi:ribose transport system substrate-binding protein